MKPYEKFLSETTSLRELLGIYLELRQHFQELGFTEKELERPPKYTEKMMRLFHRFGDTQKYLFQQVKDYGFDIGWDEFVSHIEPKLKKINELTPLKDGNSKRDDSGYEDY